MRVTQDGGGVNRRGSLVILMNPMPLIYITNGFVGGVPVNTERSAVK